MAILRRLPFTVATELDETFRSNDLAKLPIDDQSVEAMTRLVAGVYKQIDISAFQELMEDVIGNYRGDKLPASSDSWLAPRVHATLRLTRQEASDPRIWIYLAVVSAPDYVRHRFGHPVRHYARTA